jgi:hypothetical protein
MAGDEIRAHGIPGRRPHPYVTHVLFDVRYGILLSGLEPLGYPLFESKARNKGPVTSEIGAFKGDFRVTSNRSRWVLGKKMSTLAFQRRYDVRL